MTAPLYTIDILRLAAATADHPRLARPGTTAERRSTMCGSRVVVDVVTDARGRVTEFGHDVRACALGQAAATLLAQSIIGRDADEIAAARDALDAWLRCDRDDPGDWPGLDALGPARAFSARHASIRLAFEAAAEAAALTAAAR